MAGERTYPILPCADLDELLEFYKALGFEVTYRQLKPNPYGVVRREDLQLHFAGIDGFDPALSYGSAIVVVPDAEGLYADFAERLRAEFGRLPVAGIPRILRPREKKGTVSGFSVVDPGGNWLRISKAGDTEEAAEKAVGLRLAVESAARIGDAKGDEEAAAAMLDRALARHADADAEDRIYALEYRSELAVRLGDEVKASQCDAQIESIRSSDS